jgi:solute:Na+ symporter, SSS family
MTGRWVTVVGVIVGIGTAFIAAGASNIMNYLQTLFSFFNAPLFGVFVLGVLWKRMSPAGALWGYVTGIITPAIVFVWYTFINTKIFNSAAAETMYGAIISFATVLIVGTLVSLLTKPKPVDQLGGLVFGVGKIDLKGDAVVGDQAWYRSPVLLGVIALALCVALYLPFL